jgi:hypothetical protein
MARCPTLSGQMRTSCLSCIRLPLTSLVLAEVWKHGRKLVLVSMRLDRQFREQRLNPLSEFFADNNVGEVLRQLMQRQASVFFMSFQPRRPWYVNWLPQSEQRERDAWPVDSEHFIYYFDEYIAFEGSFECDDAYRRTSLNECTPPQSTNHFLTCSNGSLLRRCEIPKLKGASFRASCPFTAEHRPHRRRGKTVKPSDHA